MPLPEALYESVLALARPAIQAASLFNEKLRRGVQGRAESAQRFQEWAAAERPSPAAPHGAGAGAGPEQRPLVWVHAPSVGEGLMAQAIIAELRSRRPDVQVAFTHFSPSAERVVADVGADVWGYVPWDTRGAVRQALDALRPTALVFVRTEVWPVLAREAAERGAALLLVNAVLSEGSGRLAPMGRGLVEPMYARLDAVGAVSRAHAERYQRLGVPAERVHVTGDARFDQVWSRIEARGLFELRGEPNAAERVPEPLRPIWRALHDPEAFTMVAGSTWSTDEKALLPPLTVLRRGRRLRLVIAPHEPTPAHLESLELRLDRLALRHARLGALVAAGVPAIGPGGAGRGTAASGGAAPEIVIVDRMGVLADLYGLADVAYVGGGFGRAGLHSVVEPAALGVPVLFGPTHGNAREAADLAAHGGGFVVRSAGDVEARLRQLADDPAAATAAGGLAREFVRSETGSAARNADLIAAWLDRRPA